MVRKKEKEKILRMHSRPHRSKDVAVEMKMLLINHLFFFFYFFVGSFHVLLSSRFRLISSHLSFAVFLFVIFFFNFRFRRICEQIFKRKNWRRILFSNWRKHWTMFSSMSVVLTHVKFVTRYRMKFIFSKFASKKEIYRSSVTIFSSSQSSQKKKLLTTSLNSFEKHHSCVMKRARNKHRIIEKKMREKIVKFESGFVVANERTNDREDLHYSTPKVVRLMLQTMNFTTIFLFLFLFFY